MNPGDASNVPIPGNSAGQDGETGLGLTQVPSDRREARLRTLFQLFSNDADLALDDTTIAALAGAVRRFGYDLVPQTGPAR